MPSGFVKFVQAYRATAVLFLNFSILFVAANTVAWFVLDAPNTTTMTYKQTFDRSNYQLISPEAADATLDELDAIARAGHWKANPWTGLVMLPFKGEYVNIDERGFRKSSNTGTILDNDIVVWTFGGSTTFGWGLPDNLTIPSQLRTILSETLHRNVRIQNFGVPYFDSNIELALFIAELRTAPKKPDIAVFIDGFNDAMHFANWRTDTPMFGPIAEAWQLRTYLQQSPLFFFVFGDNLPLVKLVHELQRKFENQSQQQQQQQRKQEQQEAAPPFSRSSFNWHTIIRVATDNGVKPLILIQPMHFIRSIPKIQSDIDRWFLPATAAVNGQTIFDLNSRFELSTDRSDRVIWLRRPEEQVPVQIDTYGHYGDTFSLYIAAEICSVIVKTHFPDRSVEGCYTRADEAAGVLKNAANGSSSAKRTSAPLEKTTP